MKYFDVEGLVIRWDFPRGYPEVWRNVHWEHFRDASAVLTNCVEMTAQEVAVQIGQQITDANPDGLPPVESNARGSDLMVTAVMYAARPGVVKHLRRTGQLPAQIDMGGASIQLKRMIQERGWSPHLSEDERMVYEAILRGGFLPGGRAVMIAGGSSGLGSTKYDQSSDTSGDGEVS